LTQSSATIRITISSFMLLHAHSHSIVCLLSAKVVIEILLSIVCKAGIEVLS